MRVTAAPQRGLVGRDAELERLNALVDSTAAGGGECLLMVGEAGIGKTALLDETVARAARSGLRVLRARGVESEIELAFSTLHELLRSVVADLEQLPEPQRAALRGAMALDAGGGAVADRFTIYAATLTLLAAVADDVPVLVAVDDAQWADAASAEALAFAARRLGADRVSMVVALRPADVAFSRAGLPELTLGALDGAALVAIANGRDGRALTPDALSSLARAAAGNPLALLAMVDVLPREPGEDVSTSTTPVAVGDSIERAFAAELRALSPAVRQAAIVAAASEDGDAGAVLRALHVAGVAPGELEAAEAAGLVRLAEGRCTFRHPLLRAVVYHGASAAERRGAHRALARAFPDPSDADRQAWHLASSAVAADEEIAAALEQTAARARRRGGYAAAERALTRAAALSPRPGDRARRLLRAGEMAYYAGRGSVASALLDRSLVDVDDADSKVAIVQLRGRIAARSGSAEEATELLVGEATHLETTHPAAAGALLVEAVIPCLRSGRPREAVALAERALALAPQGGSSALGAELMLGVALLLTADHVAGTRRVGAVADRHAEAPDILAGDPQLRAYLGFALRLAGDYGRARTVLTAIIDEGRTLSAPGMLPYALSRLAGVDLETGRWASAATLLSEARELARDTGQEATGGIAIGALAWLAAAQGRADECRAHAADALALAQELGTGATLDYVGAALGLLELGLGRPEAAAAHLQEVTDMAARQGWCDAAVPPHRLPDLVEALVRAGREADARRRLAAFRADAVRTARGSALAGADRCAGVLAADGEIDGPFRRAIDAQHETPFELARTRLVYGERLRRARRRVEAREQVRGALAIFDRLGAEPWSARAAEELRASGETLRRADDARTAELTPSERQIAALVADGMTNREVAARLFVTPKTVEFHLGNVFQKLGVRSRRELAGHLPAAT